MTRRRRFLFATLMLSIIIPAATSGRAANASNAVSEVPASCPVTVPSAPAFIPPAPYPSVPPDRGFTFWHGTPGLWTRLDTTGVWKGRNKLFWWSPGFYPMGPPEALKVTGRRLDAEAPPLPEHWVTNAHVPEWGGWTMLTMLDLPASGCWEVTGSYGADTISFVVWMPALRAGR